MREKTTKLAFLIHTRSGGRTTNLFSLESFHQKYRTSSSLLRIKERDFHFFLPETIEEFVDEKDVFHDFPLWSKIWEASIVLADYLSHVAVDSEKRFLEIGCGVGVVGIVAASFGHRVTMTEYNPDALQFVRANACANLHPAKEEGLVITELDWNRPRLDGLFDYIVGSEVIYHERDFEPIRHLLHTYLRPSGEIILAEGVRKTSIEFFRRMSRCFEVKAQKKVLRSEGKEERVILAKMRFKAVL